MTIKIGIIGGSGLDNPTIFQQHTEQHITTPYGEPSSSLVEGTIDKTPVALLARHGRDHSIMPTDVNNRANIHALKSVGCTHILAGTAVGSLQEHIQPGDLVFLDQFIDHTTKRISTFCEEVKHVSMADPFCAQLRQILAEKAEEHGMRYHKKGTVITIEGRAFQLALNPNSSAHGELM